MQLELGTHSTWCDDGRPGAGWCCSRAWLALTLVLLVRACVCGGACRNSWGFMTAGRICADMAQACLIAAGRGCGATLGAVAARKLEDAEAFAADLGCAKAYGGDSVRNHNNKTAAVLSSAFSLTFAKVCLGKVSGFQSSVYTMETQYVFLRRRTPISALTLTSTSATSGPSPACTWSTHSWRCAAVRDNRVLFYCPLAISG
jgi:hypothetical protein